MMTTKISKPEPRHHTTHNDIVVYESDRAGVVHTSTDSNAHS